MTFDRWFAERFPAGYTPDGQYDVLYMRRYFEQCWQAALEQSCTNPRCSRAIHNRIDELEQLVKDYSK